MQTSGGLLRPVAVILAPVLGRWFARWALRHVQRRTERLHARMRADLLRSDENQNRTLAFSGSPE
jgi:preprotein translocase subunit SecA